jgi:hypothetical protein
VEQFWLWLVGFRSIRLADLYFKSARLDSSRNDTQAPLVQLALEKTPHDKLTLRKPPLQRRGALLPREASFVCHQQATVQMF